MNSVYAIFARSKYSESLLEEGLSDWDNYICTCADRETAEAVIADLKNCQLYNQYFLKLLNEREASIRNEFTSAFAEIGPLYPPSYDAVDNARRAFAQNPCDESLKTLHREEDAYYTAYDEYDAADKVNSEERQRIFDEINAQLVRWYHENYKPPPVMHSVKLPDLTYFDNAGVEIVRLSVRELEFYVREFRVLNSEVCEL